MTDYSQMKCEVCRVGAPLARADEVEDFLMQHPQWEKLVVDGEDRIQRKFQFKDFALALAFTKQVGALAEEEGHHPALLTEWGRVTVGWWTHKIHGLHVNDFIMASKTDTLVG